ncbi:MAG: outer membrane protein transport protein [Deltaproteobacteria bacterium]|nr:outer membrane protein transport protein [Deltaproteobacteria bacterium]
MGLDVRLAVAIPLCTAMTASDATASGLATSRYGGEHGNPISSNPTAIYFNPAAISGLEGTHLYSDTMVMVRDGSYSHAPHATDVAEPAGLEGANTDRASLMNVAVVPTLGATHALGDFTLGVGFFVPFGGGTSWSENERFAGNPSYPGAVGGAQRWHTLDGRMQLLYWTLAAAYEIPDIGLSLGVSGSLILSEIASNQARTAVADNNLETEGRSLIDVATLAGGFAAGAVFEALESQLWLGGSYTSRPNVAGGHRLTGTLKNNFGSIDEFDAELHQDIPDVIRFGVRYRPVPHLEVRLHGDWTRWSAFEDQCVALSGNPCEPAGAARPPDEPAPLQNIRRDWHDAVGVRIGVSYWITPRWETFTGFGYDGNAIPDETLEPSLVDFEDFGFAAGLRVEIIEEHLHGTLCYTHFVNVPRDNADRSETALATESFNLAPDAGGHYTETMGLINASVEVGF